MSNYIIRFLNVINLLFLLILPILIGLCNAFRLSRHVSYKSQHFLIKFALKECKVPSSCWDSVEKSLLEKRRILDCQEVEFYKLLHCLDQVIMSRTNVTDLNSKTGSVCCETIPGISIACSAACRSALYSPTLSPSNKLNRIHTICDKSEKEADSNVLKCLATTNEWLQEKFKI